MRKFLIFLALFLSGCAGVGGLENQIFVSAKAVEITAQRIRFECGNVEAGGPCLPTSRVTTAERDRIQQQLRTLTAMLATAEELRVAGSTDAADSRLAQADRLLAVIEQILLSKGVE